jgi:hypothetical protein
LTASFLNYKYLKIKKQGVMPVSLRNRTKVDQSKQEEQKSKAAVQANKSSTKPEKNQINRKNASS